MASRVDVDEIFCRLWCPGFIGHALVPLRPELIHRGPVFGFGNVYYDLVPVALVLLVLFASEVMNLVSYICSNWVKVALICSYINL
jgi:hypothetical protein